MISAALLILKEVPAKVWMILACIVAVLVGAVWAIKHFEDVGEKNALDKINNANQAAQTQYDDAVTDVHACFAKPNRNWDYATGKCKVTSP